MPADPKEPDGPKLPCTKIQLGRTKTTEADKDAVVLLVGRPVVALREWLERADITEGAVFRGIDRWGHLRPGADPASGQSDPEAPRRRGRARSGAVFRPWPALRLPDRDSPPRHSAARGDAAVAAPLGATGVALLQRRRTEARPGGAGHPVERQARGFFGIRRLPRHPAGR